MRIPGNNATKKCGLRYHVVVPLLLFSQRGFQSGCPCRRIAPFPQEIKRVRTSATRFHLLSSKRRIRL